LCSGACGAWARAARRTGVRAGGWAACGASGVRAALVLLRGRAAEQPSDRAASRAVRQPRDQAAACSGGRAEAARPRSRAAEQPDSRADVRSCRRAVVQPSRRAVVQPNSRAAVQPSSRAAGQSCSRAAGQSCSRPVEQSSSRAAEQSRSRRVSARTMARAGRGFTRPVAAGCGRAGGRRVWCAVRTPRPPSRASVRGPSGLCGRRGQVAAADR
jgi:hypothetical protein